MRIRLVLDALLPARQSDDVALPVARTHAPGPHQAAARELPGDLAFVSRSRVTVTGQLAAWAWRSRPSPPPNSSPVFPSEPLTRPLGTSTLA